MSSSALLASALLVACTLWTAAGVLAVLIVARRRPSLRRRAVAPVSVLKPLCGADAHLARNLETFFLQDHPDYELVFGVESTSDPALAIALRVHRDHPKVPCRFVVHGGGCGTNPKVRNLRAMLPEARHDLVLISDSNVAAPPHYLRELVLEMESGRRPVGLVTNLFRGLGEQSLGAALESVQLNGFCAAGAALPTLAGDPLVVGKSMLLSRAVLERLGGLDALSNVIAEDYVLGKMLSHAGYEVRLGSTVLDTANAHLGVRAMLTRQLRWAMLRARLRPTAFVLEPLTSPLVVLALTWPLLGSSGASILAGLTWALSMLLLRDALQWAILRGVGGVWKPVLLAPLRELLMLGVWTVAPFKSSVAWRGHRVHLSAGTLGYLQEG